MLRKEHLQIVYNRLSRYGMLPRDVDSLDDLCNKSDISLFNSILCNEDHVLHHLLHPPKDLHYNLRKLSHNRALPFISNS